MSASTLTLVGLAFLLIIFVSIMLWSYSILCFNVLRYIFFIFAVFFLSLYGLLILPLDISSTAYRICVAQSKAQESVCVKPSNFVPEEVLVAIWRAIYWILMVFSWLILPYAKCFAASGHFTFLKKLRFAVIYNLAFDLFYFFLFICFLCYMRFGPSKMSLDFYSIKDIVAATANTIGVFILILVMGYGLVDLPRYLWKTADYHFQYNKTLFNIASTSETIHIYKKKLEKNLAQIATALKNVTENTEAHRYLKIIISRIPEDSRQKILMGNVDTSFGSEILDYNVSLKSYLYGLFGFDYHENIDVLDYNKPDVLVSLHTDVKQNVMTLESNNFYFSQILKQGLFYEEIVNNFSVSSAISILNASNNYSQYTRWWLPKAKFIWYSYLRKITFRTLSLLSIAMSGCIFFSELTIAATNPTVSIFAILMDKLSYRSSASFLIPQLISFVTLSYMALCTYRTVFRLKLFNIVQIMSNHRTNVYSLLFSASVISFFFAPLCLNYLCLIHFDKGTLYLLNDNKFETSFSQIEGKMKLLPITNKYFYIYYPIIISVVCLVTAFSLTTRFVNNLGFGNYSINNDYSSDYIAEGYSILQTERTRIFGQLGIAENTYGTSDKDPLLNYELPDYNIKILSFS